MTNKAEVWIVDDEVDIADYLAEIVQDESCNARVFGSADDAMSVFKEETADQPDLIITDVKMPGTDGFSFIESCKEKRSDQPVIVISGYVEREFFAKAASLGIFAVLDKPFSSDLFRSLVSRVLRLISLQKSQKILIDLLKNHAENLESLLQEYVFRVGRVEDMLYKNGIALYDGSDENVVALQRAFRITELQQAIEEGRKEVNLMLAERN